MKKSTAAVVAIAITTSVSVSTTAAPVGGQEFAGFWYNSGGATSSTIPSSTPAASLQAGTETNGTPLYLCKADYSNGTHPGRTRNGLNGCSIGYGGKEVVVQSHYVYYLNQGSTATWQATSGDNIPAGCADGGKEGAGTLYVCRAKYEGGVHPGKTRKGFNGCNIGYGGKEVAVRDYEVLFLKP